MKEILAEFGSGVRERASSPLAFSFAVSWVVYNFKFIIVLFSDMDALEKLSYFENVHFNGLNGWLFGFFMPFWTAVAFIVIYPYPSRLMYRYWVWQQSMLDDIRAQAENISPLLQKKWKEQRAALKEEQARLQSEVEDSLARISRLRSENEELYSNNVELQSKLADSGETIVKLRSELTNIAEIQRINELLKRESLEMDLKLNEIANENNGLKRLLSNLSDAAKRISKGLSDKRLDSIIKGQDPY